MHNFRNFQKTKAKKGILILTFCNNIILSKWSQPLSLALVYNRCCLDRKLLTLAGSGFFHLVALKMR